MALVQRLTEFLTFTSGIFTHWRRFIGVWGLGPRVTWEEFPACRPGAGGGRQTGTGGGGGGGGGSFMVEWLNGRMLWSDYGSYPLNLEGIRESRLSLPLIVGYLRYE